MKLRFSIWLLNILFAIQLLGTPYSPATRYLIEQTKKTFGKSSAYHLNSLKKQFPLQMENENITISALVHVNDFFDIYQLHKLNVNLYGRHNNVLRVQTPLSSLNAIGEISGVVWIEVDRPIYYKMDAARSDIQADLVHTGTGLASNYTGKNVLIGILDSGFDYTHPAFENAGGQSRILKVWDQNDHAGSPPIIGNQISYGSEYSGLAMTNKMHDNAIDAEIKTHGTQVSGPAGGKAADPMGLFGGIAPDANLIFVTIGTRAFSTFDALDYIFETADKLNMPAVVNISYGNHRGPHDGTSSLDQYMDRITGSGKIIVGSAGNEGDQNLHLSHTFAGETIRVSPEPTDGETTIDIWGSPASSFELSVGVIDPATHAVIAQTSYFSTANSAYQQGLVEGTTEYVVSSVNTNPNNQRPNMQVWVSNIANNPVVYLIKANSGTVHMWNLFDGTGFQDFNRPDLYKPGDNASTIDEVCATSKSIIAVGAYLTKKIYRDINNTLWQTTTTAELHDIATFSSHGPTIDGRIKPDLCAPGERVIIPYSSYTTESIPESRLVAKTNGFWPYGAFGGTSFSAPIVTGVVGLMLEANPSLTPEDIKSIFSETSNVDNFTSSTPNNIWGVGKVNAYQAVSHAANYSNVDNIPLPNTFALHANFPNPFNPETTIQYTLEKNIKITVSIVNQNGQLIETLFAGEQAAGLHHLQWNAADKPSGVYFCQLKTQNQNAIQKLLLIR